VPGARDACGRHTCGVNLTAKFLAGFVAASLAALGVHAYFRVRRETEYFDAHLRSHASAYAASLAHGIAAVERVPAAAQFLLVQANESSPQFRARWVGLEPGAPSAELPLVAQGDLAAVRRGRRYAVELPGETGAPGILVTYVPVRPSPDMAFDTAVEVIESLQEERDFVRGTIRSTVLFSSTVLALTSGVAALLGMLFIGRPVRKLVEKAQRISSGDLSGPVVLHQRDELALLATEINAMCDRLAEARVKLESETAARIAALEQMRHADRLATVGRLASGIAHEIGTPLAVAGGRASMIASGEVIGAEAVENARIAGEQVQRISAIIRQLLDFARRRPPQKGPVDLRALAERTRGLLQPLASKRGVQLEVRDADAQLPRALGDAGQLEQALTNLVINAIQASREGGRVILSCSRERLRAPAESGGDERECLSLDVVDAGAGMNEETKAHIFEPFFTTKAVGDGSGLGLAVTYGIVREHGGWLDVESELGKGSHFRMVLPLA
jgi:two-component system, NtrC family, sensor kinase